ncbi:hypothetical protein TeGR_g11563 [Tetraparma gracilis]|uniref:Uncharacterized protein n=1 Tax=Tetraparma gracilis TaxID=2962635 RepID=A0ABQ6N7B8_9STRA|nr:hypothetical protein TeGR_g11563 [Tetraparma gracilis]
MSDSELSDDDLLLGGGPTFGKRRAAKAASTSDLLGSTFDTLISDETDRLQKRAKMRAAIEEEDDAPDAAEAAEEVRRTILGYERQLKSAGDSELQSRYDEMAEEQAQALADGQAVILGARSLFQARPPAAPAPAAGRGGVTAKQVKQLAAELPVEVRGVVSGAGLATRPLHLSALSILGGGGLGRLRERGAREMKPLVVFLAEVVNPSALPVSTLTYMLAVVAAVLNARPPLLDGAGDGAQRLFMLLLTLQLDPALHTVGPLAAAQEEAVTALLLHCDSYDVALSAPSPGEFPLIAGQDDAAGALTLPLALRGILLYSSLVDTPSVLPLAAALRIEFGTKILKLLAIVLVASIVAGAGMTQFYVNHKVAPRKPNRYSEYKTEAATIMVANLAAQLQENYAAVRHQVTAHFSKEQLRRCKEECALGETKERNIHEACNGMLGDKSKKQAKLTTFVGGGGKGE